MSFKTLLAGLFLFTFLALPTLAQTDVVIRLSNTNDGEEEFAGILQNFRNSAQFRINGRIQEIQRACDLNEDQLKRLRAASKGAMKKFYNAEKEEKQKTLERYQQQAGINVGDEDEDDNFQVNRNIAFVLRLKKGELIEKEPLWVKSVKKILTDEQKEKLEQAKTQQEKQLQEAAVDQFVARLEVQLFLSPEQREKMKAVVEEHLANYVVRTLYHPIERNRAIGQFAPPNEESEYSEFVKGFLSEDQLKEWNRWVEPEIEKLQQLPRR